VHEHETQRPLRSSAGFDLCLSFPQWQGSGRSANLRRGAIAAARTCESFAPRFDVPTVGASEPRHGINNWDSIFTQMRAAQRILQENRPRRVLTAGGDCSVDVVVIDYLHGLHPDLTVVWIDAHLDANTPDTSPSGNLHGMPVAAILGDVPTPMKDVLQHPLDTARFAYFGTRVGDEGEWSFKASRGLKTLDLAALGTGPIHIHFDLDVLDPAEFPHLAYAEPGGPGIDACVELVARIAAQADVVGLTITEFSPTDDACAADGQIVIERICRAVS
jgi:arginase